MHPYHDIWRFAKIAYDNPTGKEDLFKDSISFKTLTKDVDFCFIAEYPGRIIISFRGTTENLKEWLSNFNLYPLQEEVRTVKRGRNRYEILRETGILNDGIWGKGMIHDGFYTAWSKFKTDFSEMADWLKTKKVLCTGHSRGGSLAELCARHLAKNLEISSICTEFGSPKVGVEEYVDQYRALPIMTSSVVNGYDIVPNLPPEVLGFYPVVIPHTMYQPWWHQLFYRFRDHDPANYQKAIERNYP